MSLYINNTGIREGERIIGIGKQNRGSIIKLVRGFYPPSTLVNDELTVRDRFSAYPFFNSMSIEDRMMYLMNNGVNNKDLYMDDVNIIVKFDVLSGDYFSQHPNICNTLIGMNEISIVDAFNMFPSKIGSRAKKHTLVFRPTNWTLLVDVEKPYSCVVDVMNGLLINGTKPTYVVDGIGYKVNRGINLNPSNRVVMDEMKDYSPSLLKSVIQKIIRTKCSYVMFPHCQYPSLMVLHSAITALLIHPGSFVPNIQRFVKGSESCFKRLAVVIAEDSHVDNSYYVYALLVTALLLQREQDYIPDPNTIELLYHTSELALKSNICYTRGYSTPTDLHWFNDASKILQSIGSFESDIRMLTEYTGCSTSNNITNPLDIMPIWHAIDHHCYTDIGWFCDMEGHNDYSSLFNDIWVKSSSFNPRRSSVFNGIYSKAQEECYNFHHNSNMVPVDVKPVTFNYTLDKDYIYSIIGTLYYKNYVIVRLGNGIARRPRRDDPNHVKIPITDIERQDVMNYIRQQLGAGLNRELLPGVHIIIHGLDYIMLNGTKYTWEQLRTFQWTRYEREGINDLLDEMKNCSRLRMYCSTTWNNKIELHRIGRDGKGTKYSVHKDDSKVFNLMKRLSQYTSCISIVDGSITINDTVSFWYYRDIICSRNTCNNYDSNWYYDANCDTRIMYEYQSTSLDKLTHRDKNILWIDVGMGKTLIVMQYIKYLIDNSMMNRYCCYTLPPSALNSIMNECRLAGIGYNVIDMRKGQANCHLIPNTINLIYHDHLRLGDMADQLRYYANDLLFIVDEFHLCLSNISIRTSITVEIAKLSNRFVAVSGTILNNVDAIDDLIEWLEMTSPYPVHKNNYQVAVDSIVSEFTMKPVNVIRTEIDVPMSIESTELYKTLVPQGLGGTSKDLKFHEAINVCYNTVLIKMADYAKSIVSYGPIVIVVNDIHQQDVMKGILLGYKIHLIGIGNSITLTPQDHTDLQFIITTIKYNAGYTLTKSYIMLTSVYPSNESSRVQIEGRLVRVGQIHDVHIITFHTGIMSYMLERYKKTANMNQVLKELTN